MLHNDEPLIQVVTMTTRGEKQNSALLDHIDQNFYEQRQTNLGLSILKPKMSTVCKF